MDTTRAILYRDFLLNDPDIRANIDPGTGIGKGISGCVIDSWDFSDVDVVQHTQKRALSDGVDAGDVFLGQRRLRVSGTLYGKTRALLFDSYLDLRRILNPRLAQRESPADKGYLPLYFGIPTNRQADYPLGAIDLRVLVMPRTSQVVWQRNQQGGDDGDSLAIPWNATFVMKDPTIMSETPQDYDLYGDAHTGTAAASSNAITSTDHGLSNGEVIRFLKLAGGTGLSTTTSYYVRDSTANSFGVALTAGGVNVDITVNYSSLAWERANLNNRGNYIAILNMLIVVGSGAGTITVSAGGAENFVITVPASTGNRTIRYKGDVPLVSFEEAGSQEGLRMGSIPLTMVHPLIPDGLSAWSVTYTGITPLTGSHLWFWEAYA